jgi:hypothetical protein
VFDKTRSRLEELKKRIVAKLHGEGKYVPAPATKIQQITGTTHPQVAATGFAVVKVGEAFRDTGAVEIGHPDHVKYLVALAEVEALCNAHPDLEDFVRAELDADPGEPEAPTPAKAPPPPPKPKEEDLGFSEKAEDYPPVDDPDPVLVDEETAQAVRELQQAVLSVPDGEHRRPMPPPPPKAKATSEAKPDPQADAKTRRAMGDLTSAHGKEKAGEMFKAKAAEFGVHDKEGVKTLTVEQADEIVRWAHAERAKAARASVPNDFDPTGPRKSAPKPPAPPPSRAPAPAPAAKPTPAASGTIVSKAGSIDETINNLYYDSEANEEWSAETERLLEASGYAELREGTPEEKKERLLADLTALASKYQGNGNLNVN